MIELQQTRHCDQAGKALGPPCHRMCLRAKGVVRPAAAHCPRNLSVCLARSGPDGTLRPDSYSTAEGGCTASKAPIDCPRRNLGLTCNRRMHELIRYMLGFSLLHQHPCGP
jgi:hypothetical protein